MSKQTKEQTLQAATIAAYMEWQELAQRLGITSYNWVLRAGESVLY